MDNAHDYATTVSPSTLYDSVGPPGPQFASVRPNTVAQVPHPGGNPNQANPGLQQEGSPTCHDMDHREPSHDTPSRLEAQMPEIAIGSRAVGPYREPAMPDKQQVNAGSPYAPRQLHPGIVQRASNPMGRPRTSLRAPQSAAQKPTKSGKPRGRRSKPLNAEQRAHAKMVRNAGPKNCDCSQKKVTVWD